MQSKILSPNLSRPSQPLTQPVRLKPHNTTMTEPLPNGIIDSILSQLSRSIRNSLLEIFFASDLESTDKSFILSNISQPDPDRLHYDEIYHPTMPIFYQLLLNNHMTGLEKLEIDLSQSFLFSRSEDDDDNNNNNYYPFSTILKSMESLQSLSFSDNDSYSTHITSNTRFESIFSSSPVNIFHNLTSLSFQAIKLHDLPYLIKNTKLLFPNVTSLTIKNTDLSNDDVVDTTTLLLQFLSHFPQLTELTLSRCYLNLNQIIQLSKSPILCQLTVLDISYNGTLDHTALNTLFESPNFQENNKWTKLNLTSNFEVNKIIPLLVNSPNLTNLSTFYIEDCNISNESMMAIIQSPYITKLTHFFSPRRVSFYGFSNNALAEAFFNSPNIACLQSFPLIYDPHTSHSACKLIPKSQYAKNIQKLDLVVSIIPQHVWLQFLDSPNISSLKSLTIRGPITSRYLVWLLTSPTLKNLESLTIEKVVEEIKETSSNRDPLESWVHDQDSGLYKPHVTDSFPYEMDSPDPSGNTTLIIDNNANSWTQIFAFANTLPNLRKLSLDLCNLNDHDLYYIGQCPLMRQLEELSLRNNFLTDFGMKVFLQSPYLRRHHKPTTSISDLSLNNFSSSNDYSTKLSSIQLMHNMGVTKVCLLDFLNCAPSFVSTLRDITFDYQQGEEGDDEPCALYSCPWFDDSASINFYQ